MVLGHAHAGIRVKDLDRSVAFYKDILGFTLGRYNELDKGDSITRIRFMDHGSFSIELVEDAEYTQQPGKRQIHLAFYADDYDATLATMRAAGVVFESDDPRIAMGGRIIFFAGPDGERLELMER